MGINLLFIIVLMIFIAGSVWGWKRGLLWSVIRIISYVLGILVVIILAKGVGNFIQGSYVNVLMALILLLSIRIIDRIATFLIDTFKLVRAMPVGRLADKIAGAVLGLGEAVLVVWILFLLLISLDIMNLNAWMHQQVSENLILTILYNSNYLVKILGHFLV